MKHLTYKILMRREPAGGFTVIVPMLPGCITFGSDIDDAVSNAREAIELYIESLEAHGDTIPTEDNVFEYSLSI